MRFAPLRQIAAGGRLIRVLLFGIFAVFLYAVLIGNLIPEKVNVDLYSVAREDILSPVTMIDQAATEEKRDQAAAAVPPQYVYKDKAVFVQIEKVRAFYEEIIRSHQLFLLPAHPVPHGNNIEAGRAKQDVVPDLDSLSLNVSRDTLKTLFAATAAELKRAEEWTTDTVHDIMKNPITWSDMNEVQEEVNRRSKRAPFSDELRSAVAVVTKTAIVANKVFSAELTEEERNEAREAVEPVMIREGQILVKAGQVINEDILHKLRIVGLIDPSFRPELYGGLALIVLLLVGFLAYETRPTSRIDQMTNAHLLLLLVILLLTLYLLKAVSFFVESRFPSFGLLAPVALGTILIKLLVGERPAVSASFVFAVCASVIFNGEAAGTFHFSYGFYVWFSCLAGAVFLKRNDPKILRTGLLVAVVNVITVLGLYLIESGNHAVGEMALELILAVLSGLLAAILAYGLAPLLEATFGILSPLKLLELSRPTHPLLRKLLTEAPGTYHHSIMVANLAEAACEAIGASGLLARVAAYYHDVGKTKRPHFFIENQLNGENPHDKISPHLSKTIILSHPYDGAKMLRKYQIPEEIVAIAEQHHGTTLLKYFYHKAKKEDGDAREADFRYPGPRAKTKEAAVVEIADSVEAAVRSMTHPTKERIANLVRTIIRERLQDGQFDECDLTLEQLNTIADTLCETLNGMFHMRLEYPKDDWQKKARSQA